MNAEKRLKQYIEEDKIYNDWLNENKSYVSDFDKFCIQHCNDIKDLLEENRQLKEQMKKYEEFKNKLLVRNAFLMCGQKKFIKYLEDEIIEHLSNNDLIVQHIHGTYNLKDIEVEILEKILQKYKEIVEVKKINEKE